MTTSPAATWSCHSCGKPVPAECDGACGTGTIAERTDKGATKQKQ